MVDPPCMWVPTPYTWAPTAWIQPIVAQAVLKNIITDNLLLIIL
jgi:hypothetical protein